MSHLRSRSWLPPAILVLVCFVPWGAAEEKPADSAPGGAIRLPGENATTRKLVIAQDSIHEGQWDDAFRLLQAMLEMKEDLVIQVKRKVAGKEELVWTPLRDEVDRILDALPPNGAEAYEKRYGEPAATLLRQASKDRVAEDLRQTALLYIHTRAGLEAQRLLAGRHFDSGDFVLANLAYERLLNRQPLRSWEPRDLFQATAVFRRFGDREYEEKTWKELLQKTGDEGLHLGYRTLKGDTLRKELEQVGTQPAKPLAAWPIYRGSADRNGQGIGGMAFLESRWHQDTARETSTKNWLADGMERQSARGLPVLPATVPIAATVRAGNDLIPLVIYRSHFGIHAVDVRQGELQWESDAHWSLDKMVRDHKNLAHISQWVANGLNMGAQSILWENSIAGTLSTDGKCVYLVEDFEVHPFMGRPDPDKPAALGYPGEPSINEAVLHNELHAYDLRVGKIAWCLGGYGAKKEDPGTGLRDSYFLGPPLPLNGKLYVLNEKDRQLRLVCLDPEKDPAREDPVVWLEPLGSVREHFSRDLVRRTEAVQLAYAEGILICPTNAGTIYGVNLETRRVAWAHQYAEAHADKPKVGPPSPEPPGPATASGWKASTPVVRNGKVVFTSPDEGAVSCLRLKDGSRVWKAERTDHDLYLAGVFGSKVVIVTKKSVRALNLADGKESWKEIDTGLPSGQGVASENIYYLPLAKSAATNRPEIWAIDLEKGSVVAHAALGEREVPGNLIFFNQQVISQSATAVVSYPLLKAKLERIEKELAKDPNNPAGRFERGELRLANGDLRGAVEDLQAALDAKNNAPPAVLLKAHAKLREALAELFRKDFAAAEKYLKVFEEACKVEDTDLERESRVAEESRRRTIYLIIVGRGREQQGKVVEAFEAYNQLHTLEPAGKLIISPEDPSLKVSLQVWASGRIRALLARATPAQRMLVEELLEKELKQLREGKDFTALKGFVARTDTYTPAGREARLRLAQQLGEQAGSTALVEAEALLLQLYRQKDDRPMAGRAVEALAQLLLKKDLPADAVYYYRLLGSDFGDTVIRDKKTGADLFKEISTDKRLLPFLETPAPVWPGKVTVLPPEHGNFVRQRGLFTFEIEGDRLPYFQRHRVALNLDYHNIRLLDSSTGEEKWNKNLTRTQFATYVMLGNQGSDNTAMSRFPAYNLGHLVVLPLGLMVFGIDPINKEVVWEKNLLGPSNHQGQANVTIGPDGSLQIFYQDGYAQCLSRTGPLVPGCFCLQTCAGLVALDPSSGKTLWTRTDVSGNSRLLGNDETVLVVELNRDGKAARTRAYRLRDGEPSDVADFAAVYQKRIQTLGHLILTREEMSDGLGLQLHDVITGKEVWKKEFPAKSNILRCDRDDVCGVVSPEGKASILDVRTGKELAVLSVKPEHVQRALLVNLLQDAVFYYLAIQMPNDPDVNPFGGPWVNLMLDTGVRQMPVNGAVYAFEKTSGKLRWRDSVAQQMMLLEEYQDLPVLVFTSRYNKPIGAGGKFGNQHVAAVNVIEKRTGKLLFDEQMFNGPQFHSYNLDPNGGKIELVAPNYKVTVTVEK